MTESRKIAQLSLVKAEAPTIENIRSTLRQFADSLPNDTRKVLVLLEFDDSVSEPYLIGERGSAPEILGILEYSKAAVLRRGEHVE